AARVGTGAAGKGSGGTGSGGTGSAGTAYRYAHDEPEGVAAQQYLPDDLAGRVEYYRPTGRGFEERLGARWTWLKGLLRPEASPNRAVIDEHDPGKPTPAKDMNGT
ncbi:MAG: hypothetical protein WBP39_00790, partial [Candidatus Phosphoribacter baldrii]